MKRADICVGDMRNLVRVEYPSRVDDGAGGFTNTTWVLRAECWCRIEQKSGREGVAHDRIEASAHVEFWTHYQPGIVVTDRIVFAGKTHNIREVDDYFRDQSWLRIRADMGVLD